MKKLILMEYYIDLQRIERRGQGSILILGYKNTSLLVGESLDQEPVQRALLNSYKESINSDIVFIPDLHTNRSLFEFIKAVSPDKLVTRGKDEVPELSQVTNILDINDEGAITIISGGAELKVRSFLD